MGGPSRKQADIVRILRTRIVRGIYTGRLPSGRALARELGASHPTIELALGELRALGIVSRQPRLGTFVVPQGGASEVRPGMSALLVCPVPPDLNSASFWNSLIVFGFERACREHGLPMVLSYARTAQEAVEHALGASRSGYCAGTCLLGVSLETRHALALRQASAPVVAADWELEEPLIPSVSFDNLEAGALLAKHLIGLGHRQIIFMGQLEESPGKRDRIAGAEKALAAFGLAFLQKVSCHPKDLDRIDRFLTAAPRPTAVITMTAYLAEQVIERAVAAGLRVPRDLSVATFYDPRCVNGPDLTGAVVDFEALGRRALDALLDDNLWETPKPRLVAVDRVVGSTTAPPPPEA